MAVQIREAAQVFVKAPSSRDHYAQRPTAEGNDADDALSKGDIGLTFTTHQATVVTAVEGAPAPYATAGDAAEAAEAAKRVQCAERYGIPPDRSIALRVEDSGALVSCLLSSSSCLVSRVGADGTDRTRET